MEEAGDAEPSWLNKNKKVVGMVLAFIVVVVFILIATGKLETMKSPDGKLAGKNNTRHTRRSDAQTDNWNKKDFMDSVARFNRLATS